MKFGVRKRSFKKSFKAKTTGKIKRSVKKATTPFYGKKGVGWIKNPKKAMNNKIYRKITIDSRKLYSSHKAKKNSSGKASYSSSKGQVAPSASNNAEWTPESIYIAFLLGFIFFSFFFPVLWFVVACMIATKIILWYKKKHPKD